MYMFFNIFENKNWSWQSDSCFFFFKRYELPGNDRSQNFVYFRVWAWKRNFTHFQLLPLWPMAQVAAVTGAGVGQCPWKCRPTPPLSVCVFFSPGSSPGDKDRWVDVDKVLTQIPHVLCQSAGCTNGVGSSTTLQILGAQPLYLTKTEPKKTLDTKDRCICGNTKLSWGPWVDEFCKIWVNTVSIVLMENWLRDVLFEFWCYSGDHQFHGRRGLSQLNWNLWDNRWLGHTVLGALNGAELVAFKVRKIQSKFECWRCATIKLYPFSIFLPQWKWKMDGN